MQDPENDTPMKITSSKQMA